jgi:hypothetical protein
MARTLEEPLPVGPFLWWCHRRMEQIEREFDPLLRGGAAQSDAVQGRLLMEIGWVGEWDSRRLYRWAFELPAGLVERSIVENALDHAGGDFYRVYWSVRPPRGKGGRLGLGRRMTDAQVIAAHTVYTRGKLTVRGVAELIFERYGHASAGAADVALRTAWRSLGLPLRSCAGVNENGERCGNAPRSGHDHCHTHLGCGWRLPDDLIRQARTLHGVAGQSFVVIADALQDQTPYRSSKWLAMQLASIAASEGWHRTQQFGNRRRHAGVRAYAQHGEGVAA